MGVSAGQVGVIIIIRTYDNTYVNDADIKYCVLQLCHRHCCSVVIVFYSIFIVLLCNLYIFCSVNYQQRHDDDDDTYQCLNTDACH